MCVISSIFATQDLILSEVVVYASNHVKLYLKHFSHGSPARGGGASVF